MKNIKQFVFLAQRCRLLISAVMLFSLLCSHSMALAQPKSPNTISFDDYIEEAIKAPSQTAGLKLLGNAVKLAKNQEQKVNAFLQLSRLYIDYGDYTKAYNVLGFALDICYRNQLPIHKGLVLIEMGRCLQYRSNYVQSLEYMYDGLAQLEQLDAKRELIKADVYLADYFRNLAKYPDALQYIGLALEGEKRTQIDKDSRIQLYNRAAAIYSEMHQVDSSLYYSNLALRISREIHNLKQEATSLNEIAFIQENLKQYDAALQNYQLAEDIWNKIKVERFKMNTAANKARIYSLLGSYVKSNKILFSLIGMADSNHWYGSCRTINDLISYNYAKLNKMEKSYYYLVKSKEAELNVFKEDNVKELEEIKSRYQIDKKEHQLQQKQYEIELNKLYFEEKRKETIWLWTGFIILLFFGMVISYLLMQRSKTNKELKERNEVVEEANRTLQVNLIQIETLVQEVHHRVKNNLQFIYSIIELEMHSNSSTKEFVSLMGMQRRVMAMSLVHELLYKKDSLETISARKYIHELIDFMDQIMNTPELNVKFNIQVDDILFNTNQCIAIGMIISELLANAFKYAFSGQQNPMITIQLTKDLHSNQVSMLISDNGKGMMNKQPSKSGLGLRLIQIFTTQLNGQYTLDTQNGFTFIFIFKLIA